MYYLWIVGLQVIINFIFFCLMLMGSQGRGKKKKKICSDCHIKRFEGQNSVWVYVGSRLAFLKFRITGCREEPTLRPETALLGRKGLPAGLAHGWPLGTCISGGPTIPSLIGGALLYQQCFFMLKMCFPSGSLAFWSVPGRGPPMWPVPSKNPGRWHVTCCYSLLLEN